MKKIKYLYFNSNFGADVVAPVDKIDNFIYNNSNNTLHIVINGKVYQVVFDKVHDWVKVSDLVPEILRVLDMNFDSKDYLVGIDIETIVDRLA